LQRGTYNSSTKLSDCADPVDLLILLTLLTLKHADPVDLTALLTLLTLAGPTKPC
jgi:hypothetical protein